MRETKTMEALSKGSVALASDIHIATEPFAVRKSMKKAYKIA